MCRHVSPLYFRPQIGNLALNPLEKSVIGGQKSVIFLDALFWNLGV